MLATPDIRHMWHKAVRILPTLGDPLYWIERNRERSIAGLPELDAHKLDFYEVLVQPDRDLRDVLAAVCRILLFLLPMDYRQLWDTEKKFSMDRVYKRIWSKSGNGRLSNFPVKLIKLAFLTLVKTSQSRYYTSCNIDTITRGGLLFALTRYTVALMLCLFGSPYLPIVSNRDPFLVPLLIREAHVITCNGKKIHLTPELTINRLIGSSLAAVYIVDMKRTVTNAIKNCIHCNKKKSGKRNI